MFKEAIRVTPALCALALGGVDTCDNNTSGGGPVGNPPIPAPAPPPPPEPAPPMPADKAVALPERPLLSNPEMPADARSPKLNQGTSQEMANPRMPHPAEK